MGVLGDVFENAKVVVQKVVVKANDVYDISKLRAIKSKIASEISKTYKAIGKKYYALSKEDSIDTADFSQDIALLDELLLQYENILSQIDNAKNIKRCPVCGTAQNKEKPFCADCGTKL